MRRGGFTLPLLSSRWLRMVARDATGAGPGASTCADEEEDSAAGAGGASEEEREEDERTMILPEPREGMAGCTRTGDCTATTAGGCDLGCCCGRCF